MVGVSVRSGDHGALKTFSPPLLTKAQEWINRVYSVLSINCTCSIFIATKMQKKLTFATKPPSVHSGSSWGGLLSNVCQLASPLIVRIISLQSLHPVTPVPIITLASILLSLFTPLPGGGPRGRHLRGRHVFITKCDNGFGEFAGIIIKKNFASLSITS